VAVSLADKLDTLFAFYFAEERPTGSKDPFALRRAALAVNSILTASGYRLNLTEAAWRWLSAALDIPKTYDPDTKVKWQYNDLTIRFIGDMNVFDVNHILETESWGDLKGRLEYASKRKYDLVRTSFMDLLDFFADRLKVQQREAGVRHDLIDAVFALGGEDDLVRLLARVHALQSFMETEDGTNLLAGYKRAANILRKEDWQGADDAPHTGEEDPLVLVDDPDMREIVAAQMAEKNTHPAGKALSYTPEPAEKALIDALDTAGPQAEAAVQDERFADAMSALASLRKPIDDFFETVTVNDDEEAKRTARLGLLARFRDAVHQVADFGKIEG